MSYDPIFRERAVKYREGRSVSEACEAFGISNTAINSWQKQYEETGSLEKKPLDRKPRKIDDEQLRKDVHSRPDDFNWERAERFSCSSEGIRKALKRLKITRKKKRLPTRRSPRESGKNS